jgi:type II secretory pathway component GspD/PulD (secretin)
MQSAHPAAEAGRLRLSGWIAVTTSALLFTACAAPAFAQDASSGTPKTAPVEYRTIYLHNATGHMQTNEIVTVLRNELQRARINYVQSENAIAMQGTAEDLATAEKILSDLDRPVATWRLDYTITQTDGGKPPQHAVVVVTSGSQTRVKLGNRIPLVTGSTGADANPSTQVQYIDVGLNIDATIDDGSSESPRLQTKVEQSRLADEKSGMGAQDPIIYQAVLEDTSNLVEGKPMVLGTLDLPGTGQQKIEVTAQRVR